MLLPYGIIFIENLSYFYEKARVVVLWYSKSNNKMADEMDGDKPNTKSEFTSQSSLSNGGLKEVSLFGKRMESPKLDVKPMNKHLNVTTGFEKTNLPSQPKQRLILDPNFSLLKPVDLPLPKKMKLKSPMKKESHHLNNNNKEKHSSSGKIKDKHDNELKKKPSILSLDKPSDKQKDKSTKHSSVFNMKNFVKSSPNSPTKVKHKDREKDEKAHKKKKHKHHHRDHDSLKRKAESTDSSPIKKVKKDPENCLKQTLKHSPTSEIMVRESNKDIKTEANKIKQENNPIKTEPIVIVKRQTDNLTLTDTKLKKLKSSEYEINDQKTSEVHSLKKEEKKSLHSPSKKEKFVIDGTQTTQTLKTKEDSSEISRNKIDGLEKPHEQKTKEIDTHTNLKHKTGSLHKDRSEQSSDNVNEKIKHKMEENQKPHEQKSKGII